MNYTNTCGDTKSKTCVSSGNFTIAGDGSMIVKCEGEYVVFFSTLGSLPTATVKDLKAGDILNEARNIPHAYCGFCGVKLDSLKVSPYIAFVALTSNWGGYCYSIYDVSTGQFVYGNSKGSDGVPTEITLGDFTAGRTQVTANTAGTYVVADTSAGLQTITSNLGGVLLTYSGNYTSYAIIRIA